MKAYRFSLDIAAPPSWTAGEVAGAIGLAPSADLTQRQLARTTRWSYRFSQGKSAALRDLLQGMPWEVHPKWRSGSYGGNLKASLLIEVLYDRYDCTVNLPLRWLRALSRAVPEVDTVVLACRHSARPIAPVGDPEHPAEDLDCTREEAEEFYRLWLQLGRPEAPRASAPLRIAQSPKRRAQLKRRYEYELALNAVASTSASVGDVARFLGLPSAAFTSRPVDQGTLWRCDIEDGGPGTSLVEYFDFLISTVDTPRRRRQTRGITYSYLDVVVYFSVETIETCVVKLPLSRIRSLLEKIPELAELGQVEVSCYPTDFSE